MSSKIKRNFLVAAKNPEWFRAVSENELQRAPNKDEALFVPQNLNGAKVLSAYDKYNLLYAAVEQSAGARADYAAAIATEAVKNPAEIVKLAEQLRAIDADVRIDHLTGEAYDRMPPEFSAADGYSGKPEYLAYLRSLPDEDYNDAPRVNRISASQQAAEKIAALLQDTAAPADAQKAAVTALLSPLAGSELVKWGGVLGFHYGDGFNDWDGPSRSEAKAYFDVPKLLMKHWDELGHDHKGVAYDAFSAGKEGRRVVYLRKDFVDKLKPAGTPGA